MRRLLIIGCGDIALRMLPLLRARYTAFALVRSRERLPELRALGLRPLLGDLDKPETLGALAGIAHDVVHFVPPPPSGPHDTRSAHLIAALTKGKSVPQQVVYISTTGVYGDCDETRPLSPRTQRRADAELKLRRWGARSGVRAEAERALSPQLHSFMSESRRISNRRIKRELRVALRYPSVREGMAAWPIAAEKTAGEEYDGRR